MAMAGQQDGWSWTREYCAFALLLRIWIQSACLAFELGNNVQCIHELLFLYI